MGYGYFHPDRKLELRNRIDHATTMVNSWYADTPTLEEFRSIGFRTHVGTGPGSSIDPATDSLAYAHASRESSMGTRELNRRQSDESRCKASFAGDWVKPNSNTSPSHPSQPVVCHHQSSSPQHQPSYASVFPLSPLFNSDHGQPLVTLGLAEQQNRPSNVTDWVAAGEAPNPKTKEKKRHKSRQRGRQQDKEQEVTEPFIPPLDALSTGNHSHRQHASEPVGHVGHVRGQQGIHTTGLHSRRPQSQPPVYPRPRPAMYSIYSTPPPSNIQVQQNQSGAPANGPLSTSNPKSHSLPTLYHPSPPYGEHPHHLLYSIPPMNPGVSAKRKAKGTSSSKKAGDRASAQGRSQPKITPLTTVTYYNQHQLDEHTSPQITPPQHGRPHQPPAMLIQPYTRSSITSIPHVPTQMVANIPQFTYPIPPLMSNHQPVIPPDEYLQPERPTGTLHKLMSALKISP
ncbi:hypothetical protein P691DRAFT_28078 [Macrolepiota fuliginosa MF-IS2]|uniref:Uncharacterized protein n=1 Tax=Macrolepiota fuliginosa MF-IS2 TaxID=1400762 RepID=A0A9P6C4G5_9AGAR|nr:hypothetical protein P691DRAFT_28078 [Macrolepiota fuliginosa MF-IS2]